MNSILRRIFSILLIGLILEAGILSITAKNNLLTTIQTKTIELDFSEPQYINKYNTIKLNLKEQNSYSMIPGEPMLPIYNHLLNFPLGTKIINVKCEFSNYKTEQIFCKIESAPKPVNEKIDLSNIQKVKQNIYSNSVLYPPTEYTYHTGSGLSNDNHVTFLSIHMYPVRYSPKNNEITYSKHVKVTIEYELSTKNLNSNNKLETFDLLTICPSEFVDEITSFIDHKNNYDIKTKLVTLDEIYNGKFFTVTGRDEPEIIKYFIKNSIETWAINSVLLVGNSEKIPVRYSFTAEKLGLDPFITDLYYADIYNDTSEFCTWDKQRNGKYGEMDKNVEDINIDGMDFYPDVYIGRLLCSNIEEVKTVLYKIVHYEINTKNQDWFKNIILCGGDTFTDPFIMKLLNNRGFEGEIICDEVKNMMKQFNSTKLYANAFFFPNLNEKIDHERIPSSENINNEINKGAGFVLFCGHGYQSGWSTHPPLLESIWLRYESSDIQGLINQEKLPFTVFSACSCGDFSETTGIPSPIAWEIVKKPDGGAIASIACTTLSLGLYGKVATARCNGYMDVHLFEGYRRNNIAGSMLQFAQNHYLNDDNALRFNDPSDYLTIQEYNLFGDPTLKIGGY